MDSTAVRMPEGTHLAYTVYHETSWWKGLCRHDRPNEGRPCLMVAASAMGQGGGAVWEFGIVEYDLDRPVLHLEMFRGAWEAFDLMAPFFAALSGGMYGSLAQVRELLDELGAADETER